MKAVAALMAFAAATSVWGAETSPRSVEEKLRDIAAGEATLLAMSAECVPPPWTEYVRSLSDRFVEAMAGAERVRVEEFRSWMTPPGSWRNEALPDCPAPREVLDMLIERESLVRTVLVRESPPLPAELPARPAPTTAPADQAEGSEESVSSPGG